MIEKVVSGVGIIMSVVSLRMADPALLSLGCVMMVLGVLIKYRQEFDDQKQSIMNLREVQRRGMGSWRIADINYKIRRIEKREKA